jgi:hypothetical protein
LAAARQHCSHGQVRLHLHSCIMGQRADSGGAVCAPHTARSRAQRRSAPTAAAHACAPCTDARRPAARACSSRSARPKRSRAPPAPPPTPQRVRTACPPAASAGSTATAGQTHVRSWA